MRAEIPDNITPALAISDNSRGNPRTRLLINSRIDLIHFPGPAGLDRSRPERIRLARFE